MFFPLERTESRYFKSHWPYGFCQEGMHAQQTDGEINRSRTEDHPSCASAASPSLTPLTRPLSIISSLFLPSFLSPHFLSFSLLRASRTYTYSRCALTDGDTLPRRTKGWEECVSSLRRCAFPSPAPGFPHELVILNPGPEDERDLIVTKTQQREEGNQEATGWEILLAWEKAHLFLFRLDRARLVRKAAFH